MRIGCAFLLSISVGCGGVKALTDAGMPPPNDALQMCDPIAKFGAPMPIPGLEMIDGGTARLSSDELTIYFSADPGICGLRIEVH